MFKRGSIITAVIAVILFASFWPAAAHAMSITEFFNNPLESILIWIGDGLNVVRLVLVELISYLGTILNAVVSQPEVNYGGATVYFLWKLFRDICNLLFIVLFIFVAFGTIFNSLQWFKGWHYSSSLKGIVIAAIVINFSLAIGQTVVWAGNYATSVVISLISAKNMSAQLASSLQITKTVIGSQGSPINSVPDTVTPLNQQNPAQAIATKGFTGAAKTAFENCQKYNQKETVDGCFVLAQRFAASQNAAAIEQEILRLQSSPSMKSRLSDAMTFWWNAGRGAATGASKLSFIPGGAVYGAVKGAWNGASLSPTPKVPAKLSASDATKRILSLTLNIFLLLVIVLSFGTVIVFMVARIPVIWLLLATSSLAFFSTAWPGSDTFKSWMNQLIGWCIFSPMYLVVMYMGLFLLGQQNTLLAGMKNSAFITGTFGIIMFYGLTAAIFIGGAQYTMKYAFSFSKQAGEWFGKISGAMGVSDKTNFGINTVARKVGALDAYESVQARAVARGEKIQQSFRPLTQFLAGKTYEEKLAQTRQRRGVAGGAQEVNALSEKKVKEEQDRMEKLTWNKSRPEKIAYYTSRMNSINTAEALAARENLMRMGQLDARDIEYTKNMYPQGIARDEFDKRSKKAGKEDRAKEYKSQIDNMFAGDVAQNVKYEDGSLALRTATAQTQLQAISNTEAKNEFIKSLADRDPQVAIGLGLSPNKAYQGVATNPERLLDLPKEYTISGQPEFNELKSRIDAIFPDPGTGPLNDKQKIVLERREKFKESLILKGGNSKIAFISALMP